MVTGFGCYQWGVYDTKEDPIEIVQHDNCHDSRSHYAWIARKGNTLRCFEEHREYPHRVRASNLE